MFQRSEGLVASPENRQPMPIIAMGSTGVAPLLPDSLAGDMFALSPGTAVDMKMALP